MYRSHTCGQLRIEDVNTTVKLAGWVQKSRDLGGLTFIDLRDRYGITQVVLNMDTNEELCEKARSVGREFVIQIEGTVVERESKNKKIPTGEIEIDCSSLTILNEALTPPFTIENETDGGEDIRRKYRYLDLRRNPLQEEIRLRHQVGIQTRSYLNDIGFYEIETPYLIKSTPEGARDFVVPSRMNENEFSIDLFGLKAITEDSLEDTDWDWHLLRKPRLPIKELSNASTASMKAVKYSCDCQ